MIEEQRRRLAELKQKAAAEAQCQWDALHGAAPFPAGPSGFPPLMHHSILHHLSAGRERGEEGEHAYDTLSLESSDSMETSISMGGNSACSPDNMSRYLTPTPSHLMVLTALPYIRPTASARRLFSSLIHPVFPFLPQCKRLGCGEDRGDGKDAERSSCGEEPADGVKGEADLGHRGRSRGRVAPALPSACQGPTLHPKMFHPHYPSSIPWKKVF